MKEIEAKKSVLTRFFKGEFFVKGFQQNLKFESDDGFLNCP